MIAARAAEADWQVPGSSIEARVVAVGGSVCADRVRSLGCIGERARLVADVVKLVGGCLQLRACVYCCLLVAGRSLLACVYVGSLVVAVAEATVFAVVAVGAEIAACGLVVRC